MSQAMPAMPHMYVFQQNPSESPQHTCCSAPREHACHVLLMLLRLHAGVCLAQRIRHHGRRAAVSAVLLRLVQHHILNSLVWKSKVVGVHQVEIRNSCSRTEGLVAHGPCSLGRVCVCMQHRTLNIAHSCLGETMLRSCSFQQSWTGRRWGQKASSGMRI